MGRRHLGNFTVRIVAVSLGPNLRAPFRKLKEHCGLRLLLLDRQITAGGPRIPRCVNFLNCYLNPYTYLREQRRRTQRGFDVECLSDLPIYESPGGKCKVVRGRTVHSAVRQDEARKSTYIYEGKINAYPARNAVVHPVPPLTHSLPTQTRLYRPRFQRRGQNEWMDGWARRRERRKSVVMQCQT